MATKKENKKENVYSKGLFTGVYKGDNGNMLTATHMIYAVDGDEIMAEIENDFKLLYTFLYDQYRSFQSQQKDLFVEWPTFFTAIGRSYNTKSKAMVKLLEDCGLLKQIKMPNDNRRIKIVADVSLKNIRFINPKYDAWRAEQEANNAERVAEYTAFHEEKEKAKRQAKQPQNTTKSKTEVKHESGNEVETVTTKVESHANPKGCGNAETNATPVKQETKGIEPDALCDVFLEDCGVSHDLAFEVYSQAKPTKQSHIEPKGSWHSHIAHHHESGRLCDKCFKNSTGDWDCRDDFCGNCIPF